MLTTYRRSLVSTRLCLTLLAVGSLNNRLYGEIERFQVDSSSATASAVIVDDRALAHTTQLLPVDRHGSIVSDDLDRQVPQLLANLNEVLDAAGSDTTQIVRLNVYLSPRTDVVHTKRLLAQHLFKTVQPAVTYVVSSLADTRALLAVDAIASRTDSDAIKADAKQVVHVTDAALAKRHGSPIASVLPRGRVVYISGMAAKTKDLASATTATMAQLHGVLVHLGLQPKHVVHLKSFLKPMAEVAVAREAIRQSCPAGALPSLSFVQWSNPLPIEIEMIAFIPGTAAPDQTVQLGWRPEERRSPVYCRYAVVDSPKRVYIAGLRPRGQLSAEDQVRDIFQQLQGILVKADSDTRHLVKATYYVADDEVSRALNDVRPEIYDPERPPAASKASISGTGEAHSTITIDMIAVPAR